MATVKPLKVPRWNDTGGNRTEPLEAEKDAGWSVNDQPPSSYFNWLQFYTGDWMRWLDERLFDGGTTVDFEVKGIDGASATDVGGYVKIVGGTGNTSGNGGAASLLGGTAGATGDGGTITVRGGSGLSGDGGDATLGGGNVSTAGDGGDISVNGGFTPSGIGGDAKLLGGIATSGTGGLAQVSGGSATSSGSGGDAELLGGACVTGTGGDVTISGGNTSSAGAGGAIDITGGSGGSSSGDGGNVTIAAGASPAGNPGDVTISAADAVSGTYEGGDVNITGGDSLNNGGDVIISGGDVTGTNKTGGNVTISTGDSTGTGGSEILLQVSESDVSGSGVNSPVTYIDCGGVDLNIRMNRRLVCAWNTGNTSPIRLFPMATEPTSKQIGDIYVDSASDQIAFYNGTRFKNLDPHVYAMTELGQTITGDGTNNFFACKTNLGNRVEYTVPANTLRVGSKIHGELFLTHSGGNSESSGFRIIIGTSTALVWVAVPTQEISTFAKNVVDRYYDRTYCKFTAIIKSVGASGGSYGTSIINHYMAPGKIGLVDGNVINYRDITAGIPTTSTLYIFPILELSSGEASTCHQFTVNIE